MHLQIFDLDGSLTGQASLRDAAPWQSVRTFDFRDIGPKLRLWSRASTIETARRRIAETRWPDRETVSDASQGVQLATMQALLKY